MIKIAFYVTYNLHISHIHRILHKLHVQYVFSKDRL